MTDIKLTDMKLTNITLTDAAPSPFTLVGDPNAAACEGDFCVIPDHNEQGIVNRRLDENDV